ncbi:UNVERIFIED_CONTAM: hypothetical protein HDU68_005729, partial [Siphonaria sp. JEL0065]
MATATATSIPSSVGSPQGRYDKDFETMDTTAQASASSSSRTEESDNAESTVDISATGWIDELASFTLSSVSLPLNKGVRQTGPKAAK